MPDPEPGSALSPLTDQAVLATNTIFYAALETSNLVQMELAWAHTDEVICAHPGRPPLRGWKAVQRSWEQIFAAGGAPQVITTEQVITRRDRVAWVTLTENLLADGQTGAVSALNVFEHDGSRWRMVIHHAAPVLAARF